MQLSHEEEYEFADWSEADSLYADSELLTELLHQMAELRQDELFHGHSDGMF